MNEAANSPSFRRPRFMPSVLICIALLAIVWAVYWPAPRFGYVDFDDDYYVWRNAAVQQGFTPATLKWAFTSFEVANWHPLTWLSLMLDTEVFGPNNAFGSHFTNVALHAANAVLLFLVLQSMTGATWRSALVGGLLAVHPTHVESVAWVSERKDVLSMLLALLTVAAYTGYARHGGGRRYGLVIALLTLGLMAKPMLLTLPAALLLLDIWPLQRVADPIFDAGFWRRLGTLALEKLPLLAPVMVIGAMTLIAQGVADRPSDGNFVPFAQRIDNAIVSYARYLRMLVWPADLAVIYPNDALLGVKMWSTTQVAAAAALLALITVIALMLARRCPWLLVGWLWFMGTLVPVIGLVQIGRQAMADRYTYMPFIGLYIALAWTSGVMLGRTPLVTRIAIGGLFVCALGALGFAAHRQVWVWQDSATLNGHALSVTRNNWVAHVNLAGAFTNAGDTDKAIDQLAQALEIYPDSAWLRTYYGVVLTNAKRFDEAEVALRRAVADHPDFVAAHTNLGMMLIKAGRLNEGLATLRQAVEVDPELAESRLLLAVQLHEHGFDEDARREMDEAIRLKPAMAEQWRSLIE